MVASLDHPNVLPIFDFGDEKGRPYLVLPYLPGGSLADRMGGQPQPLPLVAAWTIQLAGALDAAHARGVLHRDVKPGNVLVTKDGRLMLGDFGIARLAEATTRLTATGMVVGTPIYMAPELARGADASPASDRYALAVMVFEMIAGQPPFLGSNPLSVLHQQVHEPVPSIGERIAEAPPALDAFLQRALAKEPERRHRTCRVMAEELVALLSPEQRAELSTLVWSGATDAGMGLSSDEAPTVVQPGGTLRLPPASPSRAGARSALTSAVTAEAPRVRRRGSPLLWGLVAGAAIAAAVLLLPRQLIFGARNVAPVAGAPSPAADGAAPVAAPSSAVANGTAAAGAAPSTAAPATSSPAATGVTSPPADSEAGADAAAEPETREVTPLEPPAFGTPGTPGLPAREVVRNAMAALRRPSHRPSAGELRQIIDTTTTAAAREPGRREPLIAAQAWARGGLAYLEGRGDEASERRQELTRMTAGWGIAWAVATFNGSNPWDLPALYADPLRNLDSLLRTPFGRPIRNGNATLAAAYSEHLDGQHRVALRLLDEAGIDSGEADSSRRALTAQFRVAEAIEARDEATVRRWLPDALDGGHAPLVRGFLIEMTALATETNGPPAAAALRNEACRLVPGYCGALSRPLDQPQQRRMNQGRWRPAPQPRPTGG